MAFQAALMELLPMVLADPDLLKRVIDNLLGKALKFTEQGSIRVTTERQGDTVRVSVVDTGSGIPADGHGRGNRRDERGEPGSTFWFTLPVAG